MISYVEEARVIHKELGVFNSYLAERLKQKMEDYEANFIGLKDMEG